MSKDDPSRLQPLSLAHPSPHPGSKATVWAKSFLQAWTLGPRQNGMGCKISLIMDMEVNYDYENYILKSFMVEEARYYI